ncbi:MAG: Tol-Pal system beta propeller repeat protein TolB [Chlorobiaceae bacterium]|nr:Tol-Pal system beta propeller repeat protein TolB [Chlorobiaceae bacterium]
MRDLRNSIAVLLVFVCTLVFTSTMVSAEAPRGTITISKEAAGRIAIALDRTSAKGGRESELARSVDGTIRSGLDFTGLFNLLQAPANMRTVQGGALNFSALNSVGAEIYTGGTMTRQSGKVLLDMEVYDALSGKQLMKKVYSGAEGQVRPMGLRFCADLVELLTGKKSLLFDSRIVYVSNRNSISVCDFDGQNVEHLTSARTISMNPVISPDGKYLAWTDYSSGKPDLYIRNLATKATASVGKPGVSIAPAWRNGSDEVATTLSFEGDQEIYLVKPNGTISRRLTSSRGIDVSPTFSPDGSKMAFVSQRSGPPQIFIQDLQGGQARRLTFSGSYNTQPSWSPAGDKIVYSSVQKNGEINIFTINADGTGLLQLTRGEKYNESPAWSPDGSMIVFMSNRQGGKRLFVMNSDGTNQRPLLQKEGDQQQPSWSKGR